MNFSYLLVIDRDKAQSSHECGFASQQTPYLDEQQDVSSAGYSNGTPVTCPACNVIYHHNKFSWTSAAPDNSDVKKCPACLRIEQGVTGGVIELGGKFMMKHKVEILQLATNTEELEKKHHPLQRIIEITEKEMVVVIATTYRHLAHQIGERVYSVCGGRVRCENLPEEKLVRVYWSRD